MDPLRASPAPCNADYDDWDALAKAMADHIRYRSGPHRDQRLIAAERKLLIAA
jgi:hypothetical protein